MLKVLLLTPALVVLTVLAQAAEPLSPALPFLAMLAGLASNTFVPFLVERSKDPTLTFEWEFVWPKLLTVGILILLLPVLVDDLAAVGAMGLQAAFLAGWSAADGADLVRQFYESRQGGNE